MGLPDQLLQLAALTSPTSPLRLSLSAIPCFNIFYLLHRLGLAISPSWITKTDRLVLSNLLYEVEFTILSVPDYSRIFLNFDSEFGRADHYSGDEKYETRRRQANAASVIEALMAACQIFVFGALREVPRSAKIFSILLERMRIALDRREIYMVDVWRRENNANLLLWVYVLACSVCLEETREWWIRQLVHSMREMNVQTRFDLEVVLKHVAWVDGYSSNVLGDIWDDVVELRRDTMIRETTDVGAEEHMMPPIGRGSDEVIGGG